MVEPARIFFRAEQRDAVIRLLVGFHPFENFLRVMQDGRGRIERNRLSRADARIEPPFSFGIIDHDHVIGKQRPETGIDQSRVAV